MGKLYQKSHDYITQVGRDEIFVEIGSDRWEGSTEYYAELAKKYDTQLITVDLDLLIGQRLQRKLSYEVTKHITFKVEVGSKWANQFSIYNKKICCLYLDNFDYDWEVGRYSEMISKQKKIYQEQFGIKLNNINCQVEHLTQMILLLPYMADSSLVVCDDTYAVNDCYIGKCGAVIPYLIMHKYQILETGDNGVILGRNLEKNSVQ